MKLSEMVGRMGRRIPPFINKSMADEWKRMPCFCCCLLYRLYSVIQIVQPVYQPLSEQRYPEWADHIGNDPSGQSALWIREEDQASYRQQEKHEGYDPQHHAGKSAEEPADQYEDGQNQSDWKKHYL